MDRTCCDGRCMCGESCPSFAPGVIDGPYKRGWRALLDDLLEWLLGDRP